jgi:hypothetical protein
LTRCRGKKIESWRDAPASLLFSFHLTIKTMIDPTTIQTLLEVGMLAFLGTLAILLCD